MNDETQSIFSKRFQSIDGVAEHTPQTMQLQTDDWASSAKALSAWTIERGLTCADSVQVSFAYEQSISMTMLNGKLEEGLSRKVSGLSIRLYREGRMLQLETNSLTERSIDQLIRRGAPALSYIAVDRAAALPPARQLAFFPRELNLLRLDALDEAYAASLLLAMEKMALNVHSATGSLGSTLEWQHNYLYIGNSKGLGAGYASSHYALSCGIKTIEGNQAEPEQSAYAHALSREKPVLEDAQRVGEKAAKYAVAKRNSRSISTGIYRLLLAPRVVRRLLKLFAQAISGALVYEKTSFLYGQLGQLIFPPWLQIFEDPWILSALGSQPFDADGVLTYPQVVVQDGCFHQYRLGQYSANRLNLQSTGHSGGPIYNWEIAATEQFRMSTQEELFQALDNGVWITELFGENVEFTDGNFSVGFVGFLVRKSRTVHPISGVTLSGNLRQLWSNVERIGNDLESGFSVLTGSWLISEGLVAGD